MQDFRVLVILAPSTLVVLLRAEGKRVYILKVIAGESLLVANHCFATASSLDGGGRNGDGGKIRD